MLVTFLTGYFVSHNEVMLENIYGGVSYIIFVIVELVLVIILSARVMKMKPATAKVCFLLYSFVSGLTFASIFVYYAIDSIMNVTDQFDDYKYNRKELTKKIYDFLNPYYINTNTRYGRYNNSDLVSSATDTDKALGDLLNENGFDCYYGSEYLRYTSFLSYTFAHVSNLMIVYGFMVILALFISIIYVLNKKTSITVSGDMIICKKISGKTVQFMLNDVKSVETTFLKGLKITGNGIKYRIILVNNNESLKSDIMNLLNNLKTKYINVSEADELIKFRKLLEEGIISQEEYEKKKANILN